MYEKKNVWGIVHLLTVDKNTFQWAITLRGHYRQIPSPLCLAQTSPVCESQRQWVRAENKSKFHWDGAKSPVIGMLLWLPGRPAAGWHNSGSYKRCINKSFRPQLIIGNAGIYKDVTLTLKQQWEEKEQQPFSIFWNGSFIFSFWIRFGRFSCISPNLAVSRTLLWLADCQRNKGFVGKQKKYLNLPQSSTFLNRA